TTPPASHAGQIQTTNNFAGSQSFEILGNRVPDDGTFNHNTFWFRSAPAATAFNPVANGTPFVTISTRQNVTGTPPVTVNDLPFVGVYMEGYDSLGNQNTIGSVLRNINGGITVLAGPGI